MIAGTTYPSRAPREAISFPVRFSSDDGDITAGHCENLSESGLLALFVTPPDIWIEGSLDLDFGMGLLGVRARVARVVGPRAGFAFLRIGEEHRSKLREMLLAARQSGDLLERL